MSDDHIENDEAVAGEVEDLSGDAELASSDSGGIGDAEAVVEHDIDALLSERDQFKDIALRLQADFDNYRKQIGRAHV